MFRKPVSRCWPRPTSNKSYYHTISKLLSMPKVSVDVPQELLDDVQRHVGEDGKFVSTSDAIRSSLRKMLDQMDEVDRRHGRIEEDE